MKYGAAGSIITVNTATEILPYQECRNYGISAFASRILVIGVLEIDFENQDNGGKLS
jgi:hypothetical protein